jgi:hypothetical protein
VSNIYWSYNPQVIRMPALPPLDPRCYDKKDRLRKECLPAAAALASPSR